MSFITNIEISKNYPAVQYDATETSGVWHEDHEVNGAQYHAANAQFIEATGKWHQMNSSQAASTFIRGCDASSYSSYGAAIHVLSGETTIEVTDCAGYNDRGSNAVLQNTIPPPANPISNISFGYYGPIAFYVKGAGNVTIDGNNTNLTDGGYTLAPGESASIAGTATHFLAVGK